MGHAIGLDSCWWVVEYCNTIQGRTRSDLYGLLLLYVVRIPCVLKIVSFFKLTSQNKECRTTIDDFMSVRTFCLTFPASDGFQYVFVAIFLENARNAKPARFPKRSKTSVHPYYHFIVTVWFVCIEKLKIKLLFRHRCVRTYYVPMNHVLSVLAVGDFTILLCSPVVGAVLKIPSDRSA